MTEWTNLVFLPQLFESRLPACRCYSNCFCSSTMLLSRGENNRGRVFHLSFAHLWLIYINLLGLVLSTGYAALNSMFFISQHIFVYIDPYKITSTDLTIWPIVSQHEDKVSHGIYYSPVMTKICFNYVGIIFFILFQIEWSLSLNFHFSVFIPSFLEFCSFSSYMI